MTIKLIAIDIDGTLINDQRQITPKTMAALKKASAAGVKVVLCTGRPMPGVADYLTTLGLADQDDQYVITFNGALAQTTSGKPLVEATVAFADYLDLNLFAAKHQVKSLIESRDLIYTTNQDISPYTVRESFLVKQPICYRSIEQLVPLQEQLLIGKVMLTDKPAKLDAIVPLLPEALTKRFTFIRSEDFYLEAVNPAAGKGNALRKLAAKLGIAIAETMAIGNAPNDESMLEAAGLGVAMGNAVPSTIACAQVTVADNNHDGVAEAVDRYALH